MPELPETAWFGLAPDWVCEVVSPVTGRLDRVRKLPIYAREEIEWLWLVDPLLQTLEIYRLEKPGWVLVGTHGGDEKVRSEPFDAIELELAAWWA